MTRSATADRDAAPAARAAAAKIIARVLTEGRYLDAALDELWRSQPTLGDRSLIQELSYGTLRWYHQLAGIAALFLERPLKTKDTDLHALLLLGLYQLRYSRVPAHAAVDATVAATGCLGKPWARGLVNACLRGALREPQRIEQAIAASEELRYSHPQWLIRAVRHDYPDTWQHLLDANNARPPMILRVNVARGTRSAYLARLKANGFTVRAHPAVETALVLDQPVSVDRLPGFFDGDVSVQDAGAQLAAIWLDVGPNDRVLDACAAPGGKAAHILERTPSPAALTAIDSDPRRLAQARATLKRLGLDARLVTADAGVTEQWWDGHPYDRVLVDAPCSATGVIRRHPDIKVRRQPEELPKLRQTQARILDGVWPCLARGGKLLYATCSILSEENAVQVRDFLARHPDAAPLPLPGGKEYGRQLAPGENDMDGFFYACLGKI